MRGFGGGSRVSGAQDASRCPLVGRALSEEGCGRWQEGSAPSQSQQQVPRSLQERQQPGLCCTCSAAGSELCAPWQAGSRCMDEESSTAPRLEQSCTGPWLCSGLDSHL